MTVSNFFQFIFGFILGVLLLVAGSVGAAFFFFNRMASAPPKPAFSETIPEPPVKPETKSADPTAAPKSAEKKPEPKKAEEEIPANAYKAKVSWSGGLSLRAEPSFEAERIGGVDYNAEVLVLKDSDDKVWQQIRLSDGTEAWIKAGNLEKVSP